MVRGADRAGGPGRSMPPGADHFTPVIVDEGERAWVALVSFVHPPALGDRFSFGGRAWEIVREKDLLRGYVARPAAPPRKHG
jgi:hypothetical protein